MKLNLEKMKTHCEIAAKNKSDVIMINRVDLLACIAEIGRLWEELLQIRDDGPEDDTRESLLAFAIGLQKRARKALESE